MTVIDSDDGGRPLPSATPLSPIRLLLSREPRVLLIHYGAELSPANMVVLDGLVTTFVAREGAADSIMHFDGVPTNFPMSTIESMARLPPRMPTHRRVYVGSDLALYGCCRLYATYQEAQGFDPPKVVRSLAEAMSFYQAEASSFHPA